VADRYSRLPQDPSLWALRWREADSNRSPLEKGHAIRRADRDGLSGCPANSKMTVGPLVRIRFPPAESLQTFGSSRAATADRVSLATMLYPFIGLGSRRALFRVVYAGANAAGIDQPAIGIVIGE
jgi:hypothetical protein